MQPVVLHLRINIFIQLLYTLRFKLRFGKSCIYFPKVQECDATGDL